MLISKWLEKSDTTVSEKEIVKILGTIPIVGLSPLALEHITGFTPEELAYSIERLSGKGFVSWHIHRYDNANSAIEGILILHSFLREALNKYNYPEKEKYINSYLNFLDTIDNVDVFNSATRIDALMVGMRSAFEKIREDPYEIKTNGDFWFRFTYLSTLIEKIISSYKHKIDPHWISRIFSENIKGSDCSLLIALGQAMARLEASIILAETIFLGASNYDCWARACCIHAAIRHWTKLDENQKKDAIKKVQNWIYKYFDKRLHLDFDYPLKDFDYYESDLDMAVALGGLCQLGDAKLAISIINSVPFERRYKMTAISDLTVLIYMLDNNRIEESQMQINRNYFRIGNNKARDLFDEYAILKGLRIPSVKNHYESSGKQMQGTLSRAAFSENFLLFCRKVGSEVTFLI